VSVTECSLTLHIVCPCACLYAACLPAEQPAEQHWAYTPPTEGLIHHQQQQYQQQQAGGWKGGALPHHKISGSTGSTGTGGKGAGSAVGVGPWGGGAVSGQLGGGGGGGGGGAATAQAFPLSSPAEAAIAEFNESYRRKYMANPFREQEGKRFLKARTHNRRRWSHVFPDGDKDDLWHAQHALNMKSLCQPAVLPLTTDYLPPVSALEGTQHPHGPFALDKQSNYTSSHYSLILDPAVCAYSSPEHLLREMVGQRLTQEFQLIRGLDVSPYRRLIPHYLQEAEELGTSSSGGGGGGGGGRLPPQLRGYVSSGSPADATAATTAIAAAGADTADAAVPPAADTAVATANATDTDTIDTTAIAVTATSTAATEASTASSATTIVAVVASTEDKAASAARDKAPAAEATEPFFYVLSMGHRIQFLAYIPSQREVKVSRYVSTGMQTAAHYEYELWVPQLQKFQRVTQTFRQFLEPEFNWNVHDEILLGNLDMLSETVRPKRLRYAIVPDSFASEGEVDAYYVNFKEMIQFLQRSCCEGTEVRVTREAVSAGGDRQSESTLGSGMPMSQAVCTGRDDAKIWMTAPPHENPKWIYARYDVRFSPVKVFHIEFHWITGDAFAIEDFVNQWFRRATKLGLKLVEVPEYFCESNLQVHPFRAQPYIPVSLPQSDLEQCPGLGERLRDISLSSRSMHVERVVLLDNPGVWIRDDDRKTDWNNYGQFDQDTDSLLSSPKPLGNIVDELAASKLAANAAVAGGAGAGGGGGIGSLGGQARRTQKRALDRQYMHRSGLACVRVVPTGGFVWLLNPSARVRGEGQHNTDSILILSLCGHMLC
jgi:hypothetical protein